jgi:hypothetical protein
MPYLGRQPGVGVRNRYIYTATASQTTFSGADDNGATLAYDDAAYVDVYLNGVLLIPVTDYAATTKTSVVLTSGAAASDLLEILAYEISSIADTVSKANGGTFDGAITVNGNFSADGGTIKLDGNYPVGTNNVALGNAALDSNVSGASNTAIGADALTTNTASWNTAVGYQAGYSNTTGLITAVGAQVLNQNTTGVSNVAVGGYTTGTDYAAMTFNTTGSYNTAVGSGALQANTTAGSNTAVGYQAGYNNQTGINSTFIGYRAGYSSVGNSGVAGHTIVGADAGYSLTSATTNTFVGKDAGYYITSGSANTIIGRYTGNQGGLDIRTASNHIVLSDGDGNPRIYWTETGMLVQTTNYNSFRTAIFQNSNNTSGNGTLSSLLGSNCNNTNSYHFIANIVGTGDRMYVYGNGNVVNTNNAYGALSDEKLKENIVDSGSQWDDIKALRIRKYSMKEDALDAPNKLGVIAQELEAAGMGGLVFESHDRDEDGNILDTSTKQVIYSVLYMKAVKALQEAMERIETLEAKVQALENA